MDTLLGEPLAQPRLSALLLTAFGAVALVLACVGLYSAMAATVREQTREIGIRIAIGATPANVRGRVLRRAMRVAAAGTFIGLIGATVVTRSLRTLLFQVSPDDPLTLAAVSGVLLLATSLAAYLPASRATRVDPIRALKAD
jgi:putative ABC transport system permease protein